MYDERKGKDRAEEVTGGKQQEPQGGGGGFGGKGAGGGTPLPLTDAQMAGKSTGIALRWNEKGFGFIKPDGMPQDLPPSRLRPNSS